MKLREIIDRDLYTTVPTTSDERRPVTLREIMVGYPGTKDIQTHPYYRGRLSRWAWRFYHFRLTRAGRWFLGLTALISLVLSAFWSLETQTYHLLLFSLSLWLLSLPAFVWPPKVSVSARHPDRIGAGETLQIEVIVTANGRLPQFDLMLHAWGLPNAVDVEPEDGIALGALSPGQTRAARLKLRCPRRGLYTIGGYRVDSDFPFGLLAAYRVFPQSTTLLVHPQFTPLFDLKLPTGQRVQPGGVAAAAQMGDSFEFVGSREWRDGDRLRDIDWRATARLSGTPTAPLIVREWHEEHFLRIGVVIDTHLPPDNARKEQAARRDALERSISLCAAVSDALARRDYIVDLFAAGGEVIRLATGRSTSYKEQILDELARLQATIDPPFETIAPRLADEMGRLTTVVCFLLSDDPARREFVENLRAQGVGVKVVWSVESESAPAHPDEVRVDAREFALGVDRL